MTQKHDTTAGVIELKVAIPYLCPANGDPSFEVVKGLIKGAILKALSEAFPFYTIIASVGDREGLLRVTFTEDQDDTTRDRVLERVWDLAVKAIREVMAMLGATRSN